LFRWTREGAVFTCGRR